MDMLANAEANTAALQKQEEERGKYFEQLSIQFGLVDGVMPNNAQIYSLIMFCATAVSSAH